MDDKQATSAKQQPQDAVPKGKKKAAASRSGKKKATRKKAGPKKASSKKTVTKKIVTKKAATKKAAAKLKKAPKKVTARKKASKRSAARGKPEPLSKSTGLTLVVVESPAKAKTIKKYLGTGYVVKASVGHIKDLPKSQLAVDLENGFLPRYETIRGKSSVLKEIKDAARDCDVVLLAPDPDREGEAIAWHLAQELGKRFAQTTHRITFNEITKQAVLAAVAKPQAINQLRFESQQARRVLDRIVGYQISPILWDKVRRGLSAGRVQSVAVRLICEREAQVQAFVPEAFWTVDATLAANQPPMFAAKVMREGEEKFRPTDEEHAQRVADIVAKEPLVVKDVVRRQRRRKAAAPLITSKLQQEAAGRLRFTAKRTMIVAQQLYEGVELGDEGQVALITYMRTDSPRSSPEAVAAARVYIAQTFGNAYLPEAPYEYRGKKASQDAHEAIRPTSLDYPPERVRPHISHEQHQLYSLIWNFFVASQMLPAIYDQTTVDIAAKEVMLRASGSVMTFAGFLKVLEATKEHDNKEGADRGGADDEAGAELPVIQIGQALTCQHVKPVLHHTQPPPRFSESTLVRELEESGIGRPSTYATILSTIVTRGYVAKNEGRFVPTELGSLVTELLVEAFPQVLDVAFTAHMEEQLDDVETGTVDWVKLLGNFYDGGFKQSVERAQTQMRDVKREETPTEHKCRLCAGVMNIKWGRNGSFVACANYPACRNTQDYVRALDGTIELIAEAKTDRLCPTCEGPMVVKRGRFGQFFACEKYPDCKGTRPLSIGVDCPNSCGSYICERRSKRGRTFYGCAGYPNCAFVSWDRPVKGPCPLCGHAHLLRKYTKRDGVTIRCPNKECAYVRDPELDDADAQAVAG